MSDIKVLGLEEVQGCEFLDYEQNPPEYSASGTEEVILHFSNGKEILIYIRNDGTLFIEGD